MIGIMGVVAMAREMDASAVMPGVRRAGGVGESRADGSDDRNATAKPVPGSGTGPIHWHPVPDRAQGPLCEPMLLRDGASLSRYGKTERARFSPIPERSIAPRSNRSPPRCRAAVVRGRPANHAKATCLRNG